MQDADFKDRMFAKQIAVMKGQAWNVVETLKTSDHGPLELTRRARVCVWDDLVDVPIAVPLRAPSAEMRRKQQPAHRRSAPQQEEIDITALSTPPQKPQSDLLMNSPPLQLASENRFNLSRENSALDVNARQSEESIRGPLSPATVQAVPWTTRSVTNSPANSRPQHRSRMSFDAPRRYHPEHDSRKRRFSSATRRGNTVAFIGEDDDDDEGDLGYAANEDLDGNRKTVIVERLEMVKSRNPVFTWC
jgi:phosphatidylinositol 4-kinase type 2